MNSDIRISIEFPTHPKTIMLLARLSLAAVWALISLWIFAAKHRPDGVLRGLTLDALRIACGYPGDMHEFLSVLKEPETRFLDDDTPEGWIVLHDWQDHNPWAYGAQARSDKARELARLRWDAERNAGRIAEGSATRNKKRIAPSPILSSPSPKNSSTDALRLSGILGEMILKNNPGHRELSNGKRDIVVRKWSADIDRLIRIDQKQPEEIERVICFVQSDKFWTPNIMSGKKLREKYETLKMQMVQREPEKSTEQKAGPQRNEAIEMLDRIKQASQERKKVRNGSATTK
jgi:hypothetical protein